MKRLFCVVGVGAALWLTGCETKPAQAPTADVGKKYGGQHLDEARKAADLVKGAERNVDDGVKGSGGDER